MMALMVLRSFTLKIGALTWCVLSHIYVFDQTLAEQLYRDKGLLIVDKAELAVKR